MGPDALLRQLGIIYKVKGTAAKGNGNTTKDNGAQTKCLALGKGGKLEYRLLVGSAERSHALRKMAGVVDAGDVLKSLLANPPRTTAEWEQRSQDINHKLKALKTPFLAGADTYVQRWVVRTLQFSAMRSHGIKRLSCGDMTCSKFGKLNPDVSGWVTRIARAFNVTALSDMVKQLGYTAPLELLSMHLCFAASPALDHYDFDVLAHKTQVLCEQQDAYRQKHGQDAIPAVLLTYARDNSKI
jgi:hypothetical protein